MALSAYEQQRLDNIANNMRVLSALGLNGTLAPPQAKKPKYCRRCNGVWSAAHRLTCSMRDDTRVDRVLRERPKRVARSYAEDAEDAGDSGDSGGDSGGDDEYNSNEEEDDEEDGSPSSSARSSPRGGAGGDGGSRSAGSSGRSSRQGAAHPADPPSEQRDAARLAAAEARRRAASEGLTLPRSKRP